MVFIFLGMFDPPFEALKSPLFSPTYASPSAVRALVKTLGCGGCALLTLTGASPIEIYEFCNTHESHDQRPGVSLDTMLAFLTTKGFVFRKVTTEDTCPRRGEIVNVLGTTHVLLSARHVAPKTTSWFVNWGNFEFHNLTEQVNTTAASFFNRPVTKTEGVYVVYNPVWQFDAKGLDKAVAEHEAKTVNVGELYSRAKDGIAAADSVMRQMRLLGNKLKAKLQDSELPVPEDLHKILNTIDAITNFDEDSGVQIKK